MSDADEREIAPEDDRVDPDRLPDNYTPAYIDVRGQGPVYVANYILLDSGWVSVTEWSGDRSKLPRHRVLALRDVRTERHGEDYVLRVADEDKRQEARADYPDRVDGLPLDEDGTVDRGEGVRADGGVNRLVVGPNDDPLPPRYSCLQCGAGYYQQRAADECCLMTDGGTEMETFHQTVCPQHESKGEAFQRPAFANIERETHEQIKDCDSSHVREFQAETVGSRPVSVPPAEFETDGGDDE